LPDTNARITSMIKRALKKNPELKSTDLKARAERIDTGIADLTGRQFHARYVIQVRKQLFGSSPKKKRARNKAQTRVRSAPANSATSFLAATYEQKKMELGAAIDDAFQRALAADSVRQIDDLLTSIERRTREFEHV